MSSPRVPDSELEYRMNEKILTLETAPKETSIARIRSRHGWNWASDPQSFSRVQHKDRGKIQAFPSKQLPEGVKPPQQLQIVAPFPVLNKKEGTLRSGGIKQTSEAWTIATGDLPTVDKLQEVLPSDCFPELLEVHNVSGTDAGFMQEGLVLYKRAVPDHCIASDRPVRCWGKPRKSVLKLWEYVDSGSHGTVFRACLSLPEPYETIQGFNAVNVVAKMVGNDLSARKHFDREVEAYSLFSGPSSDYLQSDWTGYVACTGRYGYVDSQMRHGLQPTAAPLRAVVPKFFGSYETVDSSGEAGALLLIEDCGISIEQFEISGRSKSERWSVRSQGRSQLPAMYSSLHRAGILQNSAKTSNVGVQAGPLHLPPSERTFATPSFRVFDFGRIEIREADPEHRFDGVRRLSESVFQGKAREELQEVFKYPCSY